MSATGSSSSSSQQGSSGGQEFVVRIPKQNKKRYHVMRFGAALNVDVSKWTQARMERENNIKEYKAEEELPKYGAGSEFGREQREESRRKKYGIAIKKYNPDDQPWQLKVHQGKNGKKYRGIREGGITENTSYYVFTQAPDGAFEASPVEEWYNFTPIQRYKHLSAEEAEEAFGKRDKVLNYFSIMLKKRLQNNDNPEEDEEEKKKKGSKNKKKGGDFKISDMDEWLTDSEQEEDEDEEPKDSDDDKSKKDKGKKGQEKKKKKKSQDSDEEAVEESDEGDFDTREVDYITSSSSSEEEPEEEKANREMKGVEDEEALRKLDQSEDEEEEEKEENKETNEGEEATEEKAAEAKPKHKAEKADGSSGDSSSDSSDSDFDDSKCQSAVFMQKPRKKNGSDNSASSSRANTPTKMLAQKSAQKRKADAASTSNKKAKTEGSSAGGPSASTEGITEEAVRRYLMRKPMTTTELLQKFKSKKTGLSGNQLVTTIAQILKRLNPEKQTIKQKLYLSIKPDGS